MSTRTKPSLVLHVEGSLMDVDDESSASEDDVAVTNSDSEDIRGSLVRDMEEFNVTGDDSEEELEVFQHKKEADSSKRTDTEQDKERGSDSDEPATPSLVSLMAGAVKEVEGEEQPVESSTSKVPIGLAAGFGMDMSSLPQEASTVHTTAQSTESSSADAFGIAYRPYGKQKPEYNLPSGPAFEDEAEFEQDLQHSSVFRSASLPSAEARREDDEEDEFDFDGVGCAEGASPVFSTTAVAKEQPVEIETKESVKDEISAEESTDSRQVQGEPQVSVREAARVALAEITDVYSSGLGDHDVSVMRSQEKDDKEVVLSPEMSLYETVVAMAGLEEIDEEELERQERETEEAERAREEAERKRLQDLHSQWEAVESAGDVGRSESVKKVDPAGMRTYETVSYKEAERYFRSMDLTGFRPHIVLDEPSESWSLFRSTTKLSKAAIPTEELEFPFLVAQLDYSPDEPAHLSMLRSIYKGLVVEGGGGSTMCPVQGAHWEAVGFQGSDPRTDLNRSMKMLSVLQMLHMIQTERSMSHRLFALSTGSGALMQSPVSNSGANVAALDDSWPMMLVAIGMTKHAIDALRSGQLTKEVVKAGSSLAVLHEFHHACFYCLLRSLVEHPQVHHAVHLANIKKEVNSEPLAILRAFRNYKIPKEKKNKSSEKDQYDNIEEDRGAEFDSGSDKKSFLSFSRSKEGGKAKKFLASG